MNDNTETVYIIGTVQSLFYENPTNFYKVARITIEETNATLDLDDDEIVITGTFGQLHPEGVYRFEGQVVHHAKYGQQFAVRTYSQHQPVSQEGIINYLASDRFPGIGTVIAKRIVAEYGDNAIAHILAEPERLKKITGLTAKRRKELLEALAGSQGEEEMIIGLLNYGFTDRTAYDIYNQYQEHALDAIAENPYQLLVTIEQLGFKRIDQLAERLDFAGNHPERLKGGLYVALKEILHNQGDTWTDSQTLFAQTLQLLEQSRPFLIDAEELAEQLTAMITAGDIIIDDKRLSLPILYLAEQGIVSGLSRKVGITRQVPQKQLAKSIAAVEQRQGFSYGVSQRIAIEQALQSSVFILTGGPGTGKTTVINGIVSAFCELNDISMNLHDYSEYQPFPILLAAPTGRAAKRMRETTGLPATTLHRLLNIGITGQERQVLSDVDMVDGKLLIVDEVSMVDTWLMNWLLKAVPAQMPIIFVGDKDQLPSVGPGQVLHDLIASRTIPSMELTEIFRQGEDSSIVELAHAVKHGRVPDNLTANQRDRSFFACAAEQVPHLVHQIVTRAKEKGYTSRDIQVLAPMYKGVAGIDALNSTLQDVLNTNDGSRREMVHFDRVYRVGDKVLQLVNQAERNVFNGDIGEVTALFTAKELDEVEDAMLVDFDGNEVMYTRSEWQQLRLAYCCSIHKAQGSEFPLVILPIVPQYGRMLRRDLIYTAITRSQKWLILCGDVAAIRHAVEMAHRLRRTALVGQLQEALPELVPTVADTAPQPVIRKAVVATPAVAKDEAYRLTPDNYLSIDPMIGMDGITL